MKVWGLPGAQFCLSVDMGGRGGGGGPREAVGRGSDPLRTPGSIYSTRDIINQKFYFALYESLRPGRPSMLCHQWCKICFDSPGTPRFCRPNIEGRVPSKGPLF